MNALGHLWTNKNDPVMICQPLGVAPPCVDIVEKFGCAPAVNGPPIVKTIAGTTVVQIILRRKGHSRPIIAFTEFTF